MFCGSCPSLHKHLQLSDMIGFTDDLDLRPHSAGPVFGDFANHFFFSGSISNESSTFFAEHRRSLSVPASVRLRRPLHMMQVAPPPMGPPPSAHTYMIPPPIESLLCSSAAPLSLPYWLQPPGCRSTVTKSQNRIYQQVSVSKPLCRISISRPSKRKFRRKKKVMRFDSSFFSLGTFYTVSIRPVNDDYYCSSPQIHLFVHRFAL